MPPSCRLGVGFKLLSQEIKLSNNTSIKNAYTLACHPNGGWQTWDSLRDIEGRVYIIGNELHICMQGSDGKGIEKKYVTILGHTFTYYWLTPDWASNFNFPKRLYKKYWVHRGFCNDFLKIKESYIVPALQQAIDEGLEVHIDGYSRGAGFSPFIHEQYYYMTGKQAVTTIVAKPRTFGTWNHRKLKQIFSGMTSYRITTDIVPHLPPVIFGYCHYGVVIKLTPRYKWYNIKDIHLSYGEYDE